MKALIIISSFIGALLNGASTVMNGLAYADTGSLNNLLWAIVGAVFFIICVKWLVQELEH